MQLDMTYLPMWVVPAVTFLVGLGLALLIRGQRKGKSRRPILEIPQVWPFDPRRIATSDERKVWTWLRATFPDHQVLLKLPMARYVSPQRQEKAREWLQLLSNVYCTFTVCTNDGRVIGCIDVMASPDSLPPINRQIKETLLEQCGINYWAVLRDRLPTSETLRTEFIGGDPRELAMEPPASQFVPIDNVRQRLHQTLDRNRAHRNPSAPAPLDAQPNGMNTDPGFAETQPSGYSQLQPNSFLTPTQSRRAGLDVI